MSGRITPPPPTQALGSTPFVPPPLDFSLTVTETIYFHRTHSPNHVVYVYEEAPGELRQIDFTAWIRAIHRAGRYAREVFQLPELQVGGEKPVVSILASSGELLPISPRELLDVKKFSRMAPQNSESSTQNASPSQFRLRILPLASPTSSTRQGTGTFSLHSVSNRSWMQRPPF